LPAGETTSCPIGSVIVAISQLGYLDIPLGFRGELPPETSPDVAVSGMFGGQMLSWKARLVRTEAGIDASNNTVQAFVVL